MYTSVKYRSERKCKAGQKKRKEKRGYIKPPKRKERKREEI